MTSRTKVYPELEVLRVGRRFSVRPGASVIQDFQHHVWRTGAPHTWKWITTTPHPTGEAPVIIAKISIPKRLRSGLATRAPCSICSVQWPKFDDGYLVFCSDGHLRIIGHDCGHEHFDEDSYAAALKEHDDEVAEALARTLLTERMPDLGRTLIEARAVFRDIASVLDFQERAVAGITKQAVAAMRRSRVSGQLTVDMESDADDGRGRKVVEKRVVVTATGLDALSPPTRLLGDLNHAIMEAGHIWIVQRDEIDKRLAAMNRHEVTVSAKCIRRLDSILDAARKLRTDMGLLFTVEGLTALSAWGRHSHCPTPFWMEVTGKRVYLNKGLRPLRWQRGYSLPLPDSKIGDPIVVA